MFAILAGLAAAVPRVRLGSLVAGNTYRNPAVLAKIAASIDQMSEGRLVLGLGAGWQENEHRAYGIDFNSFGWRFDRLEEACEILTSLFANARTSFTGKHYTMVDAPLDPKPVQSPIPLLIGGGGEKRTLRIAARYAQEWNVWGEPDLLAQKGAVLDRHCESEGRDPATIRRSAQALLFLSEDPAVLTRIRAMRIERPKIVGNAAEVGEIVARYRDAGVDELIVPGHTFRSSGSARTRSDGSSRTWRPRSTDRRRSAPGLSGGRPLPLPIGVPDRSGPSSIGSLIERLFANYTRVVPIVGCLGARPARPARSIAPPAGLRCHTSFVRSPAGRRPRSQDGIAGRIEGQIARGSPRPPEHIALDGHRTGDETDMTVERDKALDMALGQIEKQFGKGSIMRMGEKGYDGDRGHPHRRARPRPRPRHRRPAPGPGRRDLRPGVVGQVHARHARRGRGPAQRRHLRLHRRRARHGPGLRQGHRRRRRRAADLPARHRRAGARDRRHADPLRRARRASSSTRWPPSRPGPRSRARWATPTSACRPGS